MLGHDFIDMPSKSTEIGDNPRETIMLLRCKWCMKTPTKAREDGCPIHELEDNGKILLSVFNPEGVPYFHGRMCVTCDGPIMDHMLYKDSPHYWCCDGSDRISDGIAGCVWDVEGVKVPEEPTNVRINDVPLVQEDNN